MSTGEEPQTIIEEHYVQPPPPPPPPPQPEEPATVADDDYYSQQQQQQQQQQEEEQQQDGLPQSPGDYNEAKHPSSSSTTHQQVQQVQQSTALVQRSPGSGLTPSRRRDEETRMTLMEKHAKLMSARHHNNSQREQHLRASVNALVSLRKAGEKSPEGLEGIIQTLKEEDKEMFTRVPDNMLLPQRRHVTSSERSPNRSAYYNDSYKGMSPTCTNPRDLVDINKPLPNAIDPMSPEGKRLRGYDNHKGTYDGLSKGDFKGLQLTVEGPTRREMIQKQKEEVVSRFVRPLPKEAYVRKTGDTVVQEVCERLRNSKVPIGFVPAAASKVPDDHGIAAQEQINAIKNRTIQIPFK